MNIIAEECKVRKHHPEWSNVSFYFPVEVVIERKTLISADIGLQHDVHTLDDAFAAWVVGEGCLDGQVLR